MNNRITRAAILFAVYSAMASPAHAYLDPATGSIAVQALIGAVATWMMYSKMYAAKVRAFFVRSSRKEQNSSPAE